MNGDPDQYAGSEPSDSPQGSRSPEGTPGNRTPFRFGMLDLMLLTCLVAAWVPGIVAYFEIPERREDVKQMRALTSDLPIQDAAQLNVRQLPSIWHNIKVWKYFLPEGAEMELRFADEGISSLGEPPEFDVVPLPTGTHTIHMKYERTEDQEFVSEVYLDRELVLEKRRPKEWHEVGSSSSSGGVGSEPETHPTEGKVVLHRMRLHIRSPQRRYSSVGPPEDYDAKGMRLWIVPKDAPVDSAQRFIYPKREGYTRNKSWGHRQGIRIGSQQRGDMTGTIGIEPDFRMMLDERRRYDPEMNAISVRPVTDMVPQGEVPEQDPSDPRGLVKFAIHGTRNAQWDDEDRGQPEYSEDGRWMRAYVHYDIFPSGAKVVVETLFDSENPNRIGLLPYQASGADPIHAVQFVSRRDALCQLRYIAGLEGEGDQEYRSIEELGYVDSVGTWHEIPLDRLPAANGVADGDQLLALKLATNVEKFWKVAYPPGLGGDWKYEGNALSQTWYVPTARDGSASYCKVELRVCDKIPGTNAAVPFGAVIESVRVTVPLPAEQPIWFEYGPNPEDVPKLQMEEDAATN